MLVGNRFVVARLSNLDGIPTICRERQFASAEPLVVFGEDFQDLQRRAAEYVDRLLRGVQVSELSVQFIALIECSSSR